ncbi:MAG: peptide methionine sulfoxide reductase [Flavobacteriales bacterium]
MMPDHGKELLKAILDIPEDYCTGVYNGARYGITRAAFNTGRSQKVYANELGGKNHISLNHYCTSQGELLKPCEMPQEVVIHFLRNVQLERMDPQEKMTPDPGCPG